MPRDSLIDYFARCSGNRRDVAFGQPTGYRVDRWTYRDVANVSAQCARELEARGVGLGDRVLLWGRNSAEWVAAFRGCLLLGAIVVPVDRSSTPGFANRVAQEVDAKFVIADRENDLRGAPRPRLALESLRQDLAPRSPEPYASPPLDRRAVAQIIFTSGSTDTPKGVVITHGNILANVEPLEEAIKPYLKWERIVHPLHFLDLVPLSHVFGQFMGAWVPPLLQGAVFFQDTLNPSEIVSTIERERISVLVAVPRVLEALQHKIERDLEAAGALEIFQADFAAAANENFLQRMWRFRAIHRRFGWKFWAVISGGATLGHEAEMFWARLGFAAIQGYGMTETTSLVSVNHPFQIGRGSIGKVLQGREVKLDDNGEILVRGENIAAGYWKGGEICPVIPTVDVSSDATANYDDEAKQRGTGWFHTGDLGKLDADGNLYFKGRKANVIVTSAGMNVYPEDLEACLRREPEIKDCVVLGLDRAGNSEPCAVLLLRDERRVKQPRHAAGMLTRVNDSLAEYQRMRTWFLWPEADFPRTSTGKPNLNAIRAAVEAQWGAGSASTDADQDDGGIAQVIARLSRGASIDSKANLESDLRLSSLDRVELLGALEDRYQIDLDEKWFTSARTVGDLENIVRASTDESVAPRAEFIFPRWAQRWPVTWIRTVAYYVLAWPATHLLAHPTLYGRENLRGLKNPVLVISNHVLFLDVGFVLAALQTGLRHRLAVAMDGERLAEMRNPPRDWPLLRRWLNRMNYLLAVSLFNVFPLPKRSGFRESFRFAGELADGGWSVLVFPEGELTPDGKLQPFRSGVGMLANKLNLPVVPMRIDGAYEVREAGKIFSRPGRIQVQIGKPVEFPATSDPKEIARSLERIVAELGKEPDKQEIAKAHAAG
jgi:long-chain acyl-CoA synthetase